MHQLHIRLLLIAQDEYNPEQLTQTQWMIVWTAAWMTGLTIESQDGSGSPRHHLQEIKTTKKDINKHGVRQCFQRNDVVVAVVDYNDNDDDENDDDEDVDGEEGEEEGMIMMMVTVTMMTMVILIIIIIIIIIIIVIIIIISFTFVKSSYP